MISRPVLAAGVVVLLLAGLVSAGCGDSDEDALGGEQAKVEPTPTAPGGKLSLALNEYETRYTVSPRQITIRVDTSGDGFEDATIRDLDRDARRIFAAVYRETPYTRPVALVFKGDLSGGAGKVVTARYSITRREADAIDWADYRGLLKIKWSQYRR